MPSSSRLLALMLVFVFLVVQGCAPTQGSPSPNDDLRPYTKEFWEYMDTVTAITVFTAKPAAEVDAIWQETAKELSRLHGVLSSFEQDSDVAKINLMAGIGPVEVNPETLAVIKRALELADLTQGAFDITMAPVLRLYNFSPQNPIKPTDNQRLAALSLVDYQRVQVDEKASSVFILDKGMALDLGGIAKGFVVDYIHDYLLAKGIEHVVVNAGGDIRFSGPKPDGSPWRIGVQEPDADNRNSYFTIVSLTGGSIVSSGDYERYFDLNGVRYHHIVDPATGLPTQGVRSVTIIGPDAESADLLSTAVFVLGAEKGLSLIDRMDGYEAIVYDSQHTIHLSRGLESEPAYNNKGEALKRIDGSPMLSIRVKGR